VTTSHSGNIAPNYFLETSTSVSETEVGCHSHRVAKEAEEKSIQRNKKDERAGVGVHATLALLQRARLGLASP
jgi:hypothetical protein